MTDSSEIGRFGTLRLLKRHEPNTTIAFFPIDDEQVTFGRSKQCSVRLYYDCISEIHCTLHISEDRKAYLTVQGTNGVSVDGCEVKPAKGNSPTTIPLINGSEVEIYKKRFRFEYPPKEIRAVLLATPRHIKSRRSLRMSMIRSAQVYTPRSSAEFTPRTARRGSIKDNAEWAALMSPVKVSPHSLSQEVMLLEGTGDGAVVVEEEKDLIILEHVDEEPQKPLAPAIPSPPPGKRPSRPTFPKPSTPPAQSSCASQSGPPAPKTPSNRRKSVSSLHRAVVLRSAQRVHLERERYIARQQYEDEQEEEEVLQAVSPERELGPFELEHKEASDRDEDERGENDEIDQDEPVDSNPRTPQGPLSVLRAGLSLVKKLTFAAPEAEDDSSDEEDWEGEVEVYDADEDTVESRTPVQRNFGAFMTPQGFRPAQRVPVDVKPRASISGAGDISLFGGARRVPIFTTQDSPVPGPEMRQSEKPEVRPKITEEERKAIYQRRKSALQTPSTLPKPAPRDIVVGNNDLYTPGEDQDEDAETMLERMKEKMDSVLRKNEARKARLSFASPQKTSEFSLLAPPSAKKSLAFQIAEENLSQMQREEDTEAGSSSFSRAPYGTPISPTPRFDGIKEMFRQSAPEPKTPSFTGFKKMFEGNRPAMPPRTPSFTGMKQMFTTGRASVMATPHMRLDEMFDEEEDYEHDADRSIKHGPIDVDDDTLSSRDTSSVRKDEDADMGMEIEKPMPRSSRVEVPEVPVKFGEDSIEANPTPAPSIRPKRAVKKTPEACATEVEDVETHVSASTLKRQAASVALTEELPRSARSGKVRKAVGRESEFECAPKTAPKIKATRRTKKQAEVEEIEPEEVANQLAQLDIEDPPTTKGRRGRVAKTPQTEQVEEPVTAPARMSRRVKTETPPPEVDILALTAPRTKTTRQKKTTKSKVPTAQEDHSETDEIIPPLPKARSGRKAAAKTPVIHEVEEEEKENSEDQAVKTSAKAPATRTRKTHTVSKVETGDAPARRTRSRK